MSSAGIQNIVLLMLENRSFDHLFGHLGVDHPLAAPGDHGTAQVAAAQ
jgi:phospholipase C